MSWPAHWLALLLFVLQAATAMAAGQVPPAQLPAETRTWAMGFSFMPPRPSVADVIKGIELWSRRAEIAAIHEELPWKDLLSGMPAEKILDRDKVELVKYLRAKGLKLYFVADLNDGLSRGEDAPQLRTLGRSISEPEVQQAYRRYVLAVAEKLQPDYLCLAAETNLVRQMSARLYAAEVQAANAAARDLRKAGSNATLMTSVQVETAWGVLGEKSAFTGIDRDIEDFPFSQMMGLSSYPYLSFASPADIPEEYFSRLLRGRKMPAMIVEGGWTSISLGRIRSSPQMQARYVERLGQLADSIHARGVVQLMFSDLDLKRFPQPQPAILPLFAHIGLVDADFAPKPALAAWDALHARPLRP